MPLFVADFYHHVVLFFCVYQVHKVSGGAGDPLPLHNGQPAVTPLRQTLLLFMYLYIYLIYFLVVLIDNKCEYLLRG